MFELIVRVVLASGAMAAAGILGQPSFELTWKASLFMAAYSYLLYMMEQKGARNPGVAGLAAVADGGMIAVFLADLGVVQHFGFLSALPMVYAYWRFKSNAAMMAPLVACWLLVGANLFGGGNGFTAMLLVQALGVLVIGVVLSQVRTNRENKREAKPAIPNVDQTLQVLTDHIARGKAAQASEEANAPHQELADLEASFRDLTDSARDLEKRSRRDRACVQLFESAARQSSSPFAAIASRIHDLTGVEGVGVYTVSQTGDALVARGTAGDVDPSVNEAGIQIPRRAADADIDAQVRSAIGLSRDPDSKTKFAAVLLKLRGKVVGMVTLFHSSAIELDASARQASETSEFLAELVSDQAAREDDRRRMREAELLYTVATTTIGAATPASLAARVVRDLAEAVRLDHLSVWSLENGQATQLALEGGDHRIVEEIRFAQGQGVEGWIKSGSPVLSIANARNDGRIPSQEALKRRIGGLLIVPLEFGREPFGFVVASVSKPNGIDQGETETIRAVCAELSQALARMNAGSRGPEGLATPREFYEIVSAGGQGHLVYLEVPQREELSETFGKPAVEHAIRRFAVRLRSELPIGAAVTRRHEGDYVVFVPSNDEDYVRRWANDATALASLVGVRTPDGKTKIPLALRAKVAPINQQIHRISNPSAA
jgi:GGDEF domain-containing protein